MRPKTPWSAEEIAILRRDYPTLGIDETAANLPGRTLASIVTKARDFGISAWRTNGWTEEELEIIKKHYPSGGIRAVLPHMPGRTVPAIRTRAKILGLTKIDSKTKKKKFGGRPNAGHGVIWTAEELKILREFYPTEGAKRCAARLPGRSVSAVKNRAVITRLLRDESSPEDEFPIRQAHKPVGQWPPVMPSNLPVRSVFELAEAA